MSARHAHQLVAAMLCLASSPFAGCSPGEDERSPGARAPEATGASVVAIAVCDTVAVRWGLANVLVSRSDSVTEVSSMTGPVSACVVTAVTEDPDSTLVRRDGYWADYMTYGWRGITRWDADGPDGSSRTLIRSGVRCQVDGAWDGGDDSNPTATRSKRVTERTICWSDDSGLTPRDTSTMP